MIVNPRITAIIPAYNAAGFVGRAIESALAQTYPVVEVLVVDDGSSDETAQVVESYPLPVRLIRQSNAGPAAARNHAAREAQGDWLALLDADDAWLPNKLERQIRYTDKPAVGLVHSFCRDAATDLPIPELVSFERLWQRNCIANSSVLIRRAAFEQAGGFDEDRALISVEDYNLWLRLAASDWELVTCPKVLWLYTRGEGNLTSQVERFAQAELANIESLGKRLSLPPDKIAQKRSEIQEHYGRALLHDRHQNAARRLFAAQLKAQPTLRGLGWWAATLLPNSVLDWRRGSRSSSLKDSNCVS